MDKYIIYTENLCKKYGDYTALHNLNLYIKPGEIFCILGQNGAGKTTTINLILGFLKASSGKIFIKETEVKENSCNTRKYIAYIPEIVQLYENLSGLENLTYFSKLAGFNYQKKELIQLLEDADLQTFAFNKKLSTYSKGMKQKVGIAIAIAKQAELILMDEPTSGLDPKATHEFTKICKKIANEGKAILMATHDIFNAINVATNIGIMREGKLIQTLNSQNITANELQKIYLETI